MIANYHTHTKWCNHAKGEAEDYIREAIRLGLKEIAITDHVPHIDNSDSARMRWEEFEAYNQLLDKTIEKYKHQITIYKGFECEYEPDALDFYKTLINKYDYTVMVLGQHSCGKNRKYNVFDNMNEEGLIIYAETVCTALRSGMFSYLAHPDVILYSYPQWDSHCEQAMRKIFQVCEELKIPIEINGLGYHSNRPYPNWEMLKLSKEYKLNYLINSDAHRPEHIYPSKIRELEEKAEAFGLHVLQTLPKDRFITTTDYHR